jgi:hypothetical protein
MVIAANLFPKFGFRARENIALDPLNEVLLTPEWQLLMLHLDEVTKDSAYHIAIYCLLTARQYRNP